MNGWGQALQKEEMMIYSYPPLEEELNIYIEKSSSTFIKHMIELMHTISACICANPPSSIASSSNTDEQLSTVVRIQQNTAERGV